MANPFLGQILGSVLGGAVGGRSRGGPLGGAMGGGLGGGLGGVLGGMMGGGRSRGGGGGMLLAVMLPLAMQWVQRNGGIGSVLQRMQQKGYGSQAASWVGTGDNQPIDVGAVDQVVGREELSRLSQQLGVGEDEVAQGFTEILPEMVNRLTPEGRVPPDADDVLESGRSDLERALAQAQPH